jgi:site-specific recombinase XerD
LACFGLLWPALACFGLLWPALTYFKHVAATAHCLFHTMAQHTHILHTDLNYGRPDYIALRAFLQRVPLATIARLYYPDDSPQVTNGLEAFLLTMRDTLIERATSHNPALAESLKRMRSNGVFSSTAMGILVQAAEMPPALPAPNDPTSLWFRKHTAQALTSAGILTLADLTGYINRRGASWWRGIARIGALRARVVERWLIRFAERLGPIDLTPVAQAALHPVALDVTRPDRLAPLERATIPARLDGSRGCNRHPGFAFIQAQNDAEAIMAYLSRFADRPATLRAYQKELERLLLWAVLIAGKPLSSLLVEDCEAYKRFLLAPCPEFVGPKLPRSSKRWKPFTHTAQGAMSLDSQRQAVRIIRTAFDFLVKVRYLGGNPWAVVLDPKVVQPARAMQVGKALSQEARDALIAALDLRCAEPNAQQERIVRAMVLLMVHAGLRREEVARLPRTALADEGNNGWWLTVLGKGNKERRVPVSLRTVAAIEAHWQDRMAGGQEGGQGVPPAGALLAPLWATQTETAKQRRASGQGYTADGVYQVIMACFKRLKAAGLPQLDGVSPHDLRHTFGTQAVAAGVELDVVQAMLGHASLNTTSIYVNAKEQRIGEQARDFFGENTHPAPGAG